MTTPSDPIYGQQWHFALLGDIETIWDEYTGDGVSVVVYDDGVEYTHDDLDGNYDATMHFQYDTDGNGILETFDPAPIGLYDGHGTSCAGIIGAEEGNGEGGVGVAWDVSITGVNFLNDIQFGDGIGGFDQNDLDFIIAALEHAENFDIMSNSWGIYPGYTGTNIDNDITVAAFETVATNGRGGLGTIIVQASGNESANLNGSALNVSRHVISVAATTQNGFNADYSNWGVGMLVAAPASAVTTDLTGEAGYNWDDDSQEPFAGQGFTDPLSDADYTSTFGGTSAATPTVAGVVALMLEAEDGLGWRDVQNILAITAAQTGSALGAAPSNFELSDWKTTDSDGGASWNGGGLSYHINYGFGMIDAFAAVRMAEVWLTMFDEAETSANEQIVSFDYSGSSLVIPDSFAAGSFDLQSDFNIAQSIQIETIYLTVTIDHAWSADLTFGLIAPDGTIVPVFSGETGEFGDVFIMDGGLTWTFKIAALLGYDSAGLWSFFVSDSFGLADGGEVTDFDVEFFGSENTNDDVHIISRDFLAFTAFDPTRSVLSDTNGGNDWLNFVGVNSDGGANGDLTITMTAGSNFSVDGTVWGSLTGIGDVFENLVSGDGDDVIVGNRAFNEILGMRGNDSIEGGQGFDSIDGGAGNDTLRGNSGIDTLTGGDGEDEIYGGNAADIIDAGNNDDTVLGNLGFDLIEGGSGNDDLRGGNGRDEIYGGDDDDYINGNSGIDILLGENGNDTLIGQSGGDIMYGGANDDLLNGGSGGDILSGGDGDDTLIGGVGQDILNGNEGTDTLTGGSQADTFVFDYNTASSDVTITDFEEGQDTLQLDDGLWEFSGTLTEQDVIDDYAAQVGSDVVFTFDDGDTMTLLNFDLNDLLATDIVIYDSGIIVT